MSGTPRLGGEIVSDLDRIAGRSIAVGSRSSTQVDSEMSSGCGPPLWGQRLSVVIPVYNEISTIDPLIRRVVAAAPDAQIIVVDDGSTDGTADLLRSRRWPANVCVVRHESGNRGKGAALRTAFARARRDVVVVQDADLEYDPADFAALVAPILDGRADVVFGSRFSGSGARRVLHFWHYCGNRILTMLSNVMTGLNLTDMEAGYKAFRLDVVKRLRLVESRFGCDPEIAAKVARLRLRVYEVGISYAGRTYSEGKKITWLDGLWVLWCIVRYGVSD